MTRFDWDDLRVFLSLHRGRSIRAAARELGVSHSTISRRLDTLEATLGARLFDKLPHGLALTGAGELILERAERVESELMGLEREVIGQDRALSGRVLISMPPPVAQYLMMPHLAAFAARHPEIEIAVHTSYALADLGRREADIVIRFMEKPAEHLIGRRLPDFYNAGYATRGYLASHTLTGKRASARWIGWDDVEPFPKWVRDSPFPNCPVTWQVPDILSQIAAAKAGVGMAYLPCFIGDRDPELMRAPPGEAFDPRAGWVLTHPDFRNTERVRACVQFIAEAIKRDEDLVSGRAPINAAKTYAVAS